MVSVTATNMLSYTNYTTPTATVVEGLADIIIDYINLKADTTIQTFRDVGAYTGLLTLTLTAEEYPIIMAGMNLIIRAWNDRGPNTSLSGLSVTSLFNDPHYALYSELFKTGVDRLRKKDISFQLGEDTTGIE